MYLFTFCYHELILKKYKIIYAFFLRSFSGALEHLEDAGLLKSFDFYNPCGGLRTLYMKGIR
jgi:hypothetical protein